MGDLLNLLLGYLPSFGTTGEWVLYGLAMSGAASAVLKFGVPLLQKIAPKTNTKLDDYAAMGGEYLLKFLSLVAMNPAVQDAKAKGKPTKKKTKK